ncbi:MAG TPA: ribonuclease Y [Gemmatimonadales bacterium]|jgi:ribonuclease Y|nr:ribonuclease Y [Gemmatimonadales bacterium]
MNVDLLLPVLGGLVAGILLALLLSALYLHARRRDASALLADAESKALATLQTAAAEREQAKAAAVLEGKMEVLRHREEAERELTRRREEADRAERRSEEREKELARRGEQVGQQEKSLTGRVQGLERQETALKTREGEIEGLIREQQSKLERVAGLTAEDARRELLKKVEDEARAQAAALGRDIREQAKKEAERDAKKIIALAVQRLAAEHTAETTVAAVALPSDEMKGRIIGREGRNIRAFEQVTGVDLIIDDTPDTVVVSCFDPIRREVGRRALEALIADGRIQPSRIEEIVKKIRTDLDVQLVELGEQAAYETGIHGLHPELIKLVGRMRYRTSYGQNIYDHSKEVAWLAGMMASELHLDVALAKRGGLLHDVGKVLTHDNEGTHVELGVEVARKYRESDAVVGCIAAHHDDVAHETIESVLVQAADAVSGARPGARREAFETYVKRLTRLEEIANGFDGVEKSNVIQAGREVRVIVVPDRVDDGKAQELAESIAKRIESELQYPGQIKVTVIRETRAVGMAR